ncbi:MAG: hypothetical protein ACI30V_10060 [Muribaculaceae bacterium]
MAKILPNFWLRNSKLNAESTKANAKLHFCRQAHNSSRLKINKNHVNRTGMKKNRWRWNYPTPATNLSTYIVIEIAIS